MEVIIDIISCSWVSFHERIKGLLPAGIVGKIVIVPNEGRREWF